MIQNVLLASSLLLVAAPLAAQENFGVVGGFSAFEDLFGVVPGKRRNHTKGFCVEGTIEPLDSDIQSYSRSSLFTGNSSVVARVSHKGGKANPADDKYGLLGMALQITTPDNKAHVIAMNTEHFFNVSTTLEVLTRAIDSNGFSKERQFSIINSSARTGVEVLSDAIDWIENMDRNGYETQQVLLDGSIP